MHVTDAIRDRRAVKHFDPNHQLTDAEFQQLLENARLSPTSFNIQHWRFVRVSDKVLRQQIKAAAWDQAQVSDASELLVITADVQAWQKEPSRYWQALGGEQGQMMVGMLQDFYQDKPQLQRDEAIRSGALAAQNIMLTAKAMGYDCCPMIGFDSDQVAELIKLPQDHLIVMLIAIGKATQPAWARGGLLPAEQILVNNRFE